MTQYDFVKKFLPDYEEKLKEEIPNFDSITDNMMRLSLWSFCDRHFEEALQSFTDKVCEEQRERCSWDVDLYMTCSINIDPVKIEQIIEDSTTPNLSYL